MLDLQLLLKRSKIAGKVIANMLTFNNIDNFESCISPQGVEFSCNNTPSNPTCQLNKRRKRDSSHEVAASAAIARAFEILSQESFDAGQYSVVPSPSPASKWSFGTTPRRVRRIRVTDSPFPIKEEEEEDDGRVDKQAEDFIRRFYEQLQFQQGM